MKETGMIIFITTRNPARTDCHRIVKNIGMRCFYACTYLVKNGNDKRHLESYCLENPVWKEIGNHNREMSSEFERLVNLQRIINLLEVQIKTVKIYAPKDLRILKS